MKRVKVVAHVYFKYPSDKVYNERSFPIGAMCEFEDGCVRSPNSVTVQYINKNGHAACTSNSAIIFRPV